MLFFLLFKVTADLACAYRARHKGCRRFDVVKNGSKIRKLGLRADYIVISDIKDMLAPGASLKTFAELAKLDIKKLTFPFALFTSKAFLAEKSFPSDPALWFDTLSQSEPTQQQVDEVIAEFGAGGFANVGEYLSHYLLVDVKLLGQATVKFFDTLQDTIGYHPVDVSKLTMSSYASNAVQMYLYLNKRQANNSPDFRPLYHSVKKSCLGGLCMVTRHDCSDGSAPLNSHRIPEGRTNKGKTVVYLDETSLYGSAVS